MVEPRLGTLAILQKRERAQTLLTENSGEEAVNSLLQSWRLRLPELAELLKSRPVTYKVEVTGENNGT
jgi:hypothetical protein